MPSTPVQRTRQRRFVRKYSIPLTTHRRYQKKAYDLTITDLARLRIAADSELLSGTGHVYTQGISRQLFETKYSEAINLLQGLKTEAELRSAIGKKIAILTKSNETKKQTENKKREIEKEKLVTPHYTIPYKKADTITLPYNWIISRDVFIYSKKYNSLLVSAEVGGKNKVFMVDVAKNEYSEFIDASLGEVQAISSSHQRYALHWLREDSGDKIHIFDNTTSISTEFVIDPIISDKKELARQLQLNPEGTAVFLTTYSKPDKRTKVYAQDLKTGVAREIVELDGADIRNPIFVNDHQVIYQTVRSEWITMRFDLNSKKFEVIRESDQIPEMKYDADAQTLYIPEPNSGYTMRKIITQFIGENQPVDSHAQMNPLGERHFDSFWLLPKSGMLIHDYDNNSAVASSVKGLLQEMDHSLKYENELPPNHYDLSGATATPDTKTIFQVYATHWTGTGAPFIEIWRETKPKTK